MTQYIHKSWKMHSQGKAWEQSSNKLTYNSKKSHSQKGYYSYEWGKWVGYSKEIKRGFQPVSGENTKIFWEVRCAKWKSVKE